MWLLTILLGVVLIALGGVGCALTAQSNGLEFALTKGLTALIPAAFGAVLVVCGVLARKEHLRKHVMHAASAVGLIGFVIPAFMAGPKLPTLLSQGHVARADGSDATLAVEMQTIMAVICLAFVALCVNSFVQARLMRRKMGKPDPQTRP